MSRYTPTAGQDRENLRRFTYHAPNPDQPERYDPICEVALGLATVICENSA